MDAEQVERLVGGDLKRRAGPGGVFTLAIPLGFALVKLAAHRLHHFGAHIAADSPDEQIFGEFASAGPDHHDTTRQSVIAVAGTRFGGASAMVVM
ncbi:hypothetical protein Mkiyose1665_50440 [Mycobacterium kiyosense]|uniref:Uncharacterized protein n=1 Tax=Mycobacterium kiyosense TaxID=2871094 RepID=A0A9P3V0Z6_9MYCO|nr:hypothetical protein MKCMC460_61130 [Mycobacterium sp. 20KCMC460]GLB85699.1 hypothetical protein SRL2020028_49550 [Mycobacterium kiyosense]GLB99005.1 hypothetical protein SRL2020226_57810 [Mycobacterium kiyosense]GLC04381.1 hypothetical protein SRL2020400_49720 [Mycobacterium kiyosense]GLC10992.1 hypothetical protein SRL2020411_56380 [Mycobacterium kiyosense]